jgi:hypothetical protein
MHSADKVVPIDATISHQRTTVYASTVEDAVALAIRPADNHKVNASDERVDQSAWFNL